MKRPLDTMSENEIFDTFNSKNNINDTDVWNLSYVTVPELLETYIMKKSQ